MGLKSVGFWWSKTEPDLPRPQKFVDKSWDVRERNAVMEYLSDDRHGAVYFRGWSTCRICGEMNGSVTFNDGVYEWPEGLSHYLEKHGVKPPLEFIHHVLTMRRKMRSKSDKEP
jgi:hypothetical protein